MGIHILLGAWSLGQENLKIALPTPDGAFSSRASWGQASGKRRVCFAAELKCWAEQRLQAKLHTVEVIIIINA